MRVDLPNQGWDLYSPGASRDPIFGVSGWASSGGFGNFIGGDSGFAVELAGGADGSSDFIRCYPPMQIRHWTPWGIREQAPVRKVLIASVPRYVNRRHRRAIRIYPSKATPPSQTIRNPSE